MILDPNDCNWVYTITVLDQRTPQIDTCRTRRFVLYLRRKGEYTRNLILRERITGGLGPILHVVGGELESMGTLEAEVDALIITYLGRAAGDPTGPFQLQEERVGVPGIWPLDLAAAMRLRNVARILKANVPATVPMIDPYTP